MRGLYILHTTRVCGVVRVYRELGEGRGGRRKGGRTREEVGGEKQAGTARVGETESE